MRIAIFHPFFIGNGGGERVIDVIACMYPQADFFTLILDRKTLSPVLRKRHIRASVLNRCPRAANFYQHLMPLYPLATTMLDLSSYDLVISSGGPATKGVILRQHARHIHYCHSPVRFLWDQFPTWLARLPRIVRPVFAAAAHLNREWDFNSAQRVDRFIANSTYVSERIKSYYRQSSVVIHPPVDTSKGFLAGKRDDYYLCVARLVPGKSINLLISACNRLNRKLVVVGDGPERKSLEAQAGSTVRFVGRVADGRLAELYSKARAFLFASEEDFGIAPVEAQSFGIPVVAYGKGGVGETIIDARFASNQLPTGVLYDSQSDNAVCDAILRFERSETDFDSRAIRAHALQFDTSIFVQKINSFVSNAI